jgi:hypothetical protein
MCKAIQRLEIYAIRQAFEAPSPGRKMIGAYEPMRRAKYACQSAISELELGTYF